MASNFLSMSTVFYDFFLASFSYPVFPYYSRHALVFMKVVETL